MEDLIYKGYRIKIKVDDMEQESPRQWDNMGKMVCFHNRYDLGDKDNQYSTDNYQNWEEMEKDIIKSEDVAIIRPLYLYDHSGLRMKIGSFQGLLSQGHADFDSGQVGFIYITKAKIREEYKVKRITARLIKTVNELLENEVSIYDQYLSGDVYQYLTEDADGEVIDSCGGYYDIEALTEDAKRYVDQDIKDKQIKKEKRLKAYIKNQVPLVYRFA